jgi:hypothetical protein
MVPSMGEQWCAVVELDELVWTGRVPRRVSRIFQNWTNICYSPKSGRWAGE